MNLVDLQQGFHFTPTCLQLVADLCKTCPKPDRRLMEFGDEQMTCYYCFQFLFNQRTFLKLF